MYRLNRLPFRQWILPDRMGALDNDPILNIPPPLHARGMDFKYSSRSILTDGNGHDVLIDPSSSPDDNEVIDLVKCRTSLDRGQYQAVIAALARKFAQTQGPPDTEKSFLGVHLMSVLLDSMSESSPIIVVN
jgi:hypothetical protein